MIVAAHAGVDEFNDDFLSDSFEITIAPGFKRERGRRAPAFFHGSLVSSARGMGLNLVRLAEHDVNPSAIRLPSRNAGRKMLVRVSNTRVVIFLVFVLFGVGSGVAPLPEGLDKLVAFLIVAQLLERRPLFVRDNPGHILIEPLLVRALDFFGVVLHLLLFLLALERSLERIHILPRWILGSAGWFIRGLVGRLRILGNRRGSGQSSNQQQNEEKIKIKILMRMNPGHERDSCQTTVSVHFRP